MLKQPTIFSIQTVSLTNYKVYYALMLKHNKIAFIIVNDVIYTQTILIYNIKTSQIESEYDLGNSIVKSLHQLSNGYILTHSETMKILDIFTSPIKCYEIPNKEKNNLEDFTVINNQDIAIIRKNGLIDFYDCNYPFKKKWSIEPNLSDKIKKNHDINGWMIHYLKLSNMLVILYGQNTQVYSYIGFYDLKAKQFKTVIYDYIAIFKEDLIEISDKYILLSIIDNCNKKLYTIFNIQTCIFEKSFPCLYKDWRYLQSYPFFIHKDYTYQIEEINKDIPVIESYTKYPYDKKMQLIFCKTKSVINQNNDKSICFQIDINTVKFVKVNEYNY